MSWERERERTKETHKWAIQVQRHLPSLLVTNNSLISESTYLGPTSLLKNVDLSFAEEEIIKKYLKNKR